MLNKTEKTVLLADYKPFPYKIEKIDLCFQLEESSTTVQSTLLFERGPNEQQNLVLNGSNLKLKSVSLDGEALSDKDYSVDEETLTLKDLPDKFQLQIETEINPQDNLSLEGLYYASNIFCTQCEAEGFRKITYFPDRPDVMTEYTTKIIADKKKTPVLLSNGNLIDQGELPDGKHWASWHDPFKKPSYLFALVAGDLKMIQDTFTTCSGREIDLRIYVEAENIDKCDHAMQSLKNAMLWDEQTYGLEYDLDIYMVVAVNDFNMGAMENKGLNVFNSKYVLANSETATDDDYDGIEGVIGHEYFHNWTGNRVTCRDWFQLSLKEGLTVFRDQEFSADMESRPLKRIQDVRILRNSQFIEDAGPMAHSVRPESYVEINNFYTSTVYNKGAEVIRMYQTLLGKEGFRKGMDLYFERHDGQAVTIDDFFAAMKDANQVDLGNFKNWYKQAGTPELRVETEYDAQAGTYKISFQQATPSTPGQDKKEPFLIPVTIGLLDENGHGISLQLKGEEKPTSLTSRVLRIGKEKEEFCFINVPSRPVPSFLRNFSAPVNLSYEYTEEELAFLLAHDDDPFNQWEAGQRLATQSMMVAIENYQDDEKISVSPGLIEAIGKVLENNSLDPAIKAEILLLPTEGILSELQETINVEATHAVREGTIRQIAENLRDKLLEIYQQMNIHEQYQFNPEAVGKRSLKNICLSLLMRLNDKSIFEICGRQVEDADNMTDVISALAQITNAKTSEKQRLLNAFYEKWEHEKLVIDKWLSIQARSSLPGTLDLVKQLLEHESFDIKNPNKVRALIGGFCMGNAINFHAPDGSGYVFLADQVIHLDSANPQIAARLLNGLIRWKRYDQNRQEIMKKQLGRVLQTPKLSPGCYEIATKGLV